MKRIVVCAALLAVLPVMSPDQAVRADKAADRAGAPVAAVPAAMSPAGEFRSPRNANYTIDARLDVRSRVLTGAETIVWRNITTHPTGELRLHLYHNAWENGRTSYSRANRFGPMPWSLLLMDHWENDWGYCRIKALTILPPDGSGLAPVAPRTDFIQPDDGNPDDHTVLRVTTPSPVEPGATVRLRVEWQEKIPRPFQRAGTKGDYFLLGQWFPKVGVLEPDGTWNCRQFIQTEFYADFGVYDVTVRTPTGWVVGATGHRIGTHANGDGTSTQTFHAEDVHDFAWTTSPAFTVHADRFSEPGLPPVDIELLLLPDHTSLAGRYLSSIKATLHYYGTWFGPYAWDRLTVVDPPYMSLTDSMEYPMFVTGGSRWLTAPSNFYTEADTIHEVGHEWWYAAVANNEMEDAWMDEGVNTWAHKRVLDVLYAPKILEKRYFHDFIPLEFPSVRIEQSTHGADEADGFRSILKREPLATPSWRADESVYFVVPYGKGALMLTTLERHLGWDRWRRVMSTYAERFAFKHPKPADFFAVVNEVSGENFSWFFDQTYATSDLFDYAVGRVDSQAERGGASGGQEAPVRHRSTVDIRRWGEGRFPVEVRVTFADGRVANERWDGQARWTRFGYLTPSPVATVEVDPRHVLVLDVNYSNNSWTREPAATAAAVKWTSKWMIWLQTTMELAGFFS